MSKKKPLIHISTLTGKLDGFQAIGTNTATNKFCIKQFNSNKKDLICNYCYSYKSVTGYRKNMQPSLQRNSDLLGSRHLLDNELPFINQSYFRFQQHGELINIIHFTNLVRIAGNNPKTTFALWTKRKDIVKAYLKLNELPKNLIMVFSNGTIDKVVYKAPMGFHKVFNNVSKDIKVEEQNCTGQQCKDCLKCYQFGGTDIIIEKVK